MIVQIFKKYGFLYQKPTISYVQYERGLDGSISVVFRRLLIFILLVQCSQRLVYMHTPFGVCCQFVRDGVF